MTDGGQHVVTIVHLSLGLRCTKIIVIIWLKIVLYAQSARKRKKSDSVLLKAPTLTEKSKKQRDNTKTPPKFDYTTIPDRLNTVIWGNFE